jgi:uncharacterized membrane-anchored protein
MKHIRPLVIILNLIIVLVVFNRSVFQKEEILNRGKLLLLKLAPVDPRSLMQGDYMRLQYAISDDINYKNLPKRGFIVLKINNNGVGEKVRIQAGKSLLNKDEYLIEYTLGGSAFNSSSINIGAESYFFEEGQAERYAKAVYGGVRTDAEGNSVLVGLYNDSFKKIE